MDEVVRHSVSHCGVCGESLSDVAVESWILRQVHDLPLLRLVFGDHQAEEKRCQCCGNLNRDPFPGDVNSVVQWG